MRRYIVLITIAAFASLLLTACGSDGDDAGPTSAPQGVVIESILPVSGAVGTDIVITGSGFTAENNDIGFTNPAIDFQGQHTAYLNGVASVDGTTLRFTLPDVLGACAFSQLGPDEACEAIGLVLPLDGSDISVINANGTSNRVFFPVAGATPTVNP